MLRLILNIYSLLVVGWAFILGVQEIFNGKINNPGVVLISPLLLAIILNLTAWRKNRTH